MSLKQKIGIVVSDKMDKSAVVAINIKYKHNLYG
jgi:ribosomal protein S17